MKRAGLLLDSWDEGRPACVDVTVVSPLTRLPMRVAGVDRFAGTRALPDALSRKTAKHADACTNHGHSFIAAGATTFGALADSTVQLLRRVQTCLKDRTMDKTIVSQLYVFRRVGFAIQSGLADQFLARRC